MYKLPKAEQSAWAGDIAAIATTYYVSIYGGSEHTAPDPTNVMLVFLDNGKLIAWSATFPGKIVLAKLDIWQAAETMIVSLAGSDFFTVEQYIQSFKRTTRYYMELTKDGNSYRPFTIER